MRKIQSILLHLCSVFFLYIYYDSHDIVDFNNLRIMGAIGITQLLLSIWSWKREGSELISSYMFFLLSLYVFSFGQSLLYTFNIVSESRDLLGFYGIGINDIYESQFLTLIMLSFFHIGGLLSLKKEKILHNRYLTVDYSIAAIKLGWILFIISFIPFWYNLVLNSINSILHGYGSLYTGKVVVGISATYLFIADFHIPSAIILYIGYRKQKRMRMMIIGILLIIISLILLTGGRTEAVIIGMLLILLYNYVVKKISYKGYVYLGIASILVFSILSLVSNLRSVENRDINTYLEYNATNNASVDAIAEMGGSMSCLIWTKKIVPSKEDYRYGRSYLFSFTSLIPNLGFWEMHPARKESNMGDWLTERMSLSYGTGYSMVAEAYINFGSFCWVMMLFLGYLFGRLFEISYSDLYHDSLKLIFTLIIFWFCVKLARNSFIGFVRAFFYYALPVYYFIKMSRSNIYLKKYQKLTKVYYKYKQKL